MSEKEQSNEQSFSQSEIYRSLETNQQKAQLWEEVTREVEDITDKIGQEIDPGIKETVIAFKVLGLNTSGSCEGHKDWGTGGPYLDIESPLAEALEANIEAASEADAESLDREIRIANESERLKLQHLLDEFYSQHEIHSGKMLSISTFGRGWSRLESEDVTKGLADPSKLEGFQQEMRDFTEFAKQKYWDELK